MLTPVLFSSLFEIERLKIEVFEILSLIAELFSHCAVIQSVLQLFAIPNIIFDQ